MKEKLHKLLESGKITCCNKKKFQEKGLVDESNDDNDIVDT